MRLPTLVNIKEWSISPLKTNIKRMKILRAKNKVAYEMIKGIFLSFFSKEKINNKLQSPIP